MHTLVIYHGSCFDGFTAAWVARQAWPDAEFAAMHHGDPAPDVRGKRVFILDFSFDRETVIRLHREAAELVLLDHHASAKTALSGLDFCFFDLERSGAGLAWDYFFPGTHRPDVVNYVEDRDLERYGLADSRAHHAGVTTFPMTWEAWDKLALTKNVAELGKPVLEFCRRIAEKFAARAGLIELKLARGPLKCWSANVPVEFLVETAEILKPRLVEGRKLPVVCWSWDHTRQNYYCSIRSDDMDVSAIAVELGGGGHIRAAGFRLLKRPT